jgi:putative Mg2+ transporter-C (MgtC) family protein
MFAVNIAVALVLGIAIGLERQWWMHPAGLRTNTLVALGAALFVSFSSLVDDAGQAAHIDPTRIVSYVVSGLGFLGGGVILREGMTVKGLNTAATIWCTGAVGSLAGSGFLLEATFGTGAILLVHIGLRPVAIRMEKLRLKAVDVETNYRIRVTYRGDKEALIRNILLRHAGDNPKINIQSLATDETDPTHPSVVAALFATERCDRVIEDIIKRLCIEPEVTGASWQRIQG